MVAACSSLSLEECNWDEAANLSGHRCSVSEAITMMYDRLQLVEGIGATNASKLLSVAMPKLFVMWDFRNVRSLHGLSDTANEYTKFLADMQQYVRELIAAVNEQEQCRRPQAISWLKRLPLTKGWNSVVARETPLAELLDEFYYHLPASQNC
ncbi:MAG: hypothetical protein EXR48_03005 [Dehalococcoidia bacterium]|nr:hypothetical protein [Dehalococcoidia bacterium]